MADGQLKNLKTVNITTLITLHPSELRQIIREEIEAAIGNAPKPQSNNLLSRKDVCSRFEITYATLNKWDKRGILPSTKLGNRRFYREIDIVNAIEQGIAKWKKTYR